MELHMDMSPIDGYLSVVVTGEYNLERAKSYLIEAINIAIEHNLNRILVNFLEMKGGPTLFEDFEYAVFLTTEFRRAVIENGIVGMRMVYVGNTPTSKFAEMVATNRGVVGKVMTDIDQALDWLLSE